MKRLFITGCYRSGTTLLDKVLHHHPRLCVADQPFPFLFYWTKEKFNRLNGIETIYPLGPLFRRSAHSLDAFHEFLTTYRLTSGDLDEIFSALASFKGGVGTPGILERRGEIRPGTFLEVYRQLCDCLLSIFPTREAEYVGSKEIFCEEYTPFLLDHEISCIIIVRDPRNVVASHNFSGGKNYTGAYRPILYTLRIWRKSVAFALDLSSNARFHFLRYEDLIQDPQHELAKICRFLSIDPFPEDVLLKPLKDQTGKAWGGNSSFGQKAGIDTGSLHRYKEVLPASAGPYIETCCLPEMLRMGYAPHSIDGLVPEVIREFREPCPVTHERFASDYGVEPANLEDEVARLHLLMDRSSDSESHAPEWFLSDKVERELRTALRQGAKEVSAR